MGDARPWRARRMGALCADGRSLEFKCEFDGKMRGLEGERRSTESGELPEFSNTSASASARCSARVYTRG